MNDSGRIPPTTGPVYDDLFHDFFVIENSLSMTFCVVRQKKEKGNDDN